LILFMKMTPCCWLTKPGMVLFIRTWKLYWDLVHALSFW
jgi:hypothetical protein